MTDDIRRFGTDGKEYVWAKYPGGWLGRTRLAGELRLIAIDDVGEIRDTGRRKPWDEAAPTPEEAVNKHLAGAIAAADAALERRRAKAEEEKPPEPSEPPLDRATERFLSDDDNAEPLEPPQPADDWRGWRL